MRLDCCFLEELYILCLLLISPVQDGLLRCWSLADIFTPQGISYNNQNDSTHSNNISPLFSASEHSLTITDIFIGSTTNCIFNDFKISFLLAYIITSSLDMTIKIWDPFTFRCIFSYTLPSAVNCVCLLEVSFITRFVLPPHRPCFILAAQTI